MVEGLVLDMRLEPETGDGSMLGDGWQILKYLSLPQSDPE